MSTGTLREVPEAKLRAYLARVYAAFKGEVPHVHHETNMFEQVRLPYIKKIISIKNNWKATNYIFMNNVN